MKIIDLVWLRRLLATSTRTSYHSDSWVSC